jgi:pimeloyl-ACP methyl ester carboxylesterase
MESVFVLLVLGLAASWYLATSAWAKLLLAGARRAAGLGSNTVSVGGLNWHYLRGGTGPLMVALHGFGGDADNWFRAAPILGRHFTVLAPDLPGFGSSGPADALQFDIDSQVARLHAFLQHLGAAPMVLAGNSMGGWIASAYALRYPDTVRALWLLAPLGVADCHSSDLLDAIERDRENPLTVASKTQFRRRIVGPMFGRRPWIPGPLMDHYARRAIRRGPQAVLQFRQLMASGEALEAIVGQLRLPIHLQWGSADRAVDPSGAQALLRARPDIVLQKFEGLGHLPMLEAPRKSTEHFLRFCQNQGILR